MLTYFAYLFFRITLKSLSFSDGLSECHEILGRKTSQHSMHTELSSYTPSTNPFPFKCILIDYLHVKSFCVIQDCVRFRLVIAVRGSFMSPHLFSSFSNLLTLSG